MRALLFLIVSYFMSPMALAQVEKASEEGPSFIVQMIPFAFMFLIFYFLLMRPQANKQKKHQEFISKLKKGDQVLTSSGIFGTIEGLTERYVTLEISDGVNIRVLKTFVAQPVKEG